MDYCAKCHRIITQSDALGLMRPDLYAFPAQDFGPLTHQFCQDCLDAEEIATAKSLGEWEPE